MMVYMNDVNIHCFVCRRRENISELQEVLDALQSAFPRRKSFPVSYTVYSSLHKCYEHTHHSANLICINALM